MTIYLLLALFGFIGGCYYLYEFGKQLRAEPSISVVDAVASAAFSSPLATGISMDAIFCGIGFLVWLVHEAKSLGMRRSWVYVALLFTSPLAFVFPAFLYMRERRLSALGWE